MFVLNIFTDFCNWWWLAWLLPFILGLLLGYAQWGKWARKSRELEDDLATVKNKLRTKEKELKTCNNESTRIQGELNNLKSRNKELKSKLEFAKTSVSNIDSGSAVTAAVNQTMPKKLSEKQPAGFASIKNNNFQLIEGIGPQMEALLYENGIMSWSNLASKSVGELKAILDKYGENYKVIDPSDWPSQAQYAVIRNWEGLMKFQKSEGSDSKAEKFFKSKGWI